MRPSITHRKKAQKGFTVAELITVVVIIGVLASLALPVARFSLRRQKEVDLRDRIRRITNAIDHYHDLRVTNQVVDQPSLAQGTYPKDLEELVKGVDLVGGEHVVFLRPRDLIDPMTNSDEWDTRSSTDDPESRFTDGNNLFDVHSKSTQLSLDGKTRYNEW